MITIYPPHKNQPIFLPRVAKFRIALLDATWGENYGSKMTTTSASQCVWVATCTKDPCAELVSNGFRLVSAGFPPSFLGSLLKKHRESWVIFGGICEGPPVLDVLICSHFESTGLADPDKQTSESLGFELPAHQSCHIQNKTSKSLERDMGCQISAG